HVSAEATCLCAATETDAAPSGAGGQRSRCARAARGGSAGGASTRHRETSRSCAAACRGGGGEPRRQARPVRRLPARSPGGGWRVVHDGRGMSPGLAEALRHGAEKRRGTARVQLPVSVGAVTCRRGSAVFPSIPFHRVPLHL